MVSEKDLKPAKNVLDRIAPSGRLENGKIQEDHLIPILQELQRLYGYLPRNIVEFVSREGGIPLSLIFGVITFYAQFHTAPRGKHTVCCCRGTACHVKGGETVIDEVKDILGIGEGETSEDKEFSLETVACLGACALAPLVVLDGAYHGEMTPLKAEKLLQKLKDPE